MIEALKNDKGEINMGFVGGYDCGCPSYGYSAPVGGGCGYGGGGFALIVVLFVLLIIVGVAWC